MLISIYKYYYVFILIFLYFPRRDCGAITALPFATHARGFLDAHIHTFADGFAHDDFHHHIDDLVHKHGVAHEQRSAGVNDGAHVLQVNVLVVNPDCAQLHDPPKLLDDRNVRK